MVSEKDTPYPKNGCVGHWVDFEGDFKEDKTTKLSCCPIFRLPSCRFDGAEADDGEAGGAKNPPGTEKDDRRSDRRQQQQHNQLQGLCQDDAGQALRRAQAVSIRCFVLVFKP